MLKDKLDDLLIFAKVADVKNFSKTADQLNMVKSMVSKRISRLETNLGVRLLNRSTRSMSLTEAGQTLYEYTVRIQDELSNAMQAISVDSTQPKGQLRIMSPLSFGNYYLARLIALFQQQYPEIKTEIVLSSHLMDLNAAGLDVAIHIGQPPDSNYLARKIAMRTMCVCATPEYFKKHGTPQTLEELKSHNCLIHRHLPESNHWTFKVNNQIKKIKIQGNFVANSSQTLKHAAMADLGIVMLPDYVLQTEIEERRLMPIFQEYCSQNIGVYALFPYTKHITPKLRFFLDHLVNNLNEHPIPA